MPDPACTLGHRTVAFTAFLHYGVGTTTCQVANVLNAHLQLKVTEGGLTQMGHRLADVLEPWYEQIRSDCSTASVLNADETSWYLNEAPVWLWCFCTKRSTYYAIDESWGHEALDKYFAGQVRQGFTDVLGVRGGAGDKQPGGARDPAGSTDAQGELRE